MAWSYALFMVYIFLCNCWAGVASYLDLREKLFQTYSPDMRPTRDWSKQITVGLSLTVYRLNGVNEKEGKCFTSGWLSLHWTDEFLAWDPGQYDGIQDIVVRANQIWTPDIRLLNGVHSFPEINEGGIRARIKNGGNVSMKLGGDMETICDFDLMLFPFDFQTCNIIISNWIYNENEISLIFEDEHLDKSFTNVNVNGQWEILDMTASEGDQSQFISFAVSMKRRAKYYVVNLIIPATILSALVLSVFYLHPSCGERIGFGITIFLSYTVFLLQLSDVVPENSLSTPVIVIYAALLLVSSGVSVISSVMLSYIHTSETFPSYSISEFLADCCACIPMSEARSKMESYGSITGQEPPKETLASLAGKPESEEGKKRKYLKKAAMLDWMALTTTAATILLCNIVLIVAAYLHS